MCGIAGKVQFNGNPVAESLVARMCQAIEHRGPDDQGIHVEPYVGLGQRRLAIIDLNREACAPLSNEDGTIWVTFNGEIYNYRALRTQLVERGHVFRTQSDTEVIVHLYEEYGEHCLEHMRGMFALAIWDRRRKQLFAARDRLGKKPFFYAKSSRSFVFGSEIKAITADPDVSVSPNFPAIDAYLTYQYIPSPETAFEGICKLPAAHYLVCRADGECEVTRYWSVPTGPKSQATTQELEGELLRLLMESVRLRLIADVPLGAFLSGGIDSGTVVALMAQESGERIRTFSIGLEDDERNELPYARMVADRYGTDHHEFVIRPYAAEVLPQLVRHYNEPFADSSALPTFYVSQLTRTQVTVALSGDGGDESFCGYDNYARVAAWSKVDAVPWFLRSSLAPTVAAVLDRLPYHNGKARASRALAMVGSRTPDRFFLQSSILKAQEKRACYTAHFRSLVDGAVADNILRLDWDESMDKLDWMSRHDQTYYLPDCLMVKTDVASMANSLEVRCPLLDHRLVEFAAALPSSLKRNRSGGKVILRRVAERLLPDEVLRKPKTGFGIPLEKWFRKDLAGLLRGALLDARAVRRGLFNPAFVKRMINEQVDGRRNWSNRLWALLFLEMWFREFID